MMNYNAPAADTNTPAMTNNASTNTPAATNQ